MQKFDYRVERGFKSSKAHAVRVGEHVTNCIMSHERGTCVVNTGGVFDGYPIQIDLMLVRNLLILFIILYIVIKFMQIKSV